MNPRIRVSPKEDRTVDGITFASKSEMNRYIELRMLERAGLIKDLELQPKYQLQEEYTHHTYGKQRAIYYIGDFKYKDKELGWQVVVEDHKGHKTEIYKIKKKLFLFNYPFIFFRETRA